MAKIQPVKAGDVITEGLLNRIVDQFERFANLTTSSPYIRLWDGPYGKSIALALPQQTWALLSGASSPYSFTEVRDGPGGTWVSMPNGDSGTANVYEVNGKSGLSGKVVPITWTAAGDWRFQWVGYGCAADALHFCACGCSTAFPKTLFIGDINGTHTLTGNTLLGVGARWTTPSISMPGTTVHCPANLTFDCSAFSTTQTFTYFYRLTLRCTAGSGDPAGWKLEVVFNMAGCADGQRLAWTPCTGNVFVNFGYPAFLPFDCDYSLLNFSMPTMLTGGVTATPGGGGSLTVVP